MTPQEFCYWLQGYFELTGSPTPVGLHANQVQQIRNHLNMVFIHSIDPQAGSKTEALNQAHNDAVNTMKPSHLPPLMRC